MARQKGIEPPASPLGGVRSILLSYWRRAYQTAQPSEKVLYPNSCQLSTVGRAEPRKSIFIYSCVEYGILEA